MQICNAPPVYMVLPCCIIMTIMFTSTRPSYSVNPPTSLMARFLASWSQDSTHLLPSRYMWSLQLEHTALVSPSKQLLQFSWHGSQVLVTVLPWSPEPQFSTHRPFKRNLGASHERQWSGRSVQVRHWLTHISHLFVPGTR